MRTVKTVIIVGVAHIILGVVTAWLPFYISGVGILAMGALTYRNKRG